MSINVYEMSYLDPGAYITGMFFACACIIAAYGAMTGATKIKGLEAPLAIIGLMGGYMWWAGEDFDFLFNWF